MTHAQSGTDRVVAAILEGIRGGRWRPGERLPSQAELRRIYSCGQKAMLEVSDRFQGDGILRRRGGGFVVGDLVEARLRAMFLSGKRVGDPLAPRKQLETAAVATAIGTAEALDELARRGEITPAEGPASWRRILARGTLSERGWVAPAAEGWLVHPRAAGITGRYLVVGVDHGGRVVVGDARQTASSWTVVATDEPAAEAVAQGDVRSLFVAAISGADALRSKSRLVAWPDLAPFRAGEPRNDYRVEVFALGRDARHRMRRVFWSVPGGPSGFTTSAADRYPELVVEVIAGVLPGPGD